MTSAETVQRGALSISGRLGRLKDAGDPSRSADLPVEFSRSPAEAVIGRNSPASRVQRKQPATNPYPLRNDLKRVLMAVAISVGICLNAIAYFQVQTHAEASSISI